MNSEHTFQATAQQWSVIEYGYSQKTALFISPILLKIGIIIEFYGIYHIITAADTLCIAIEGNYYVYYIQFNYCDGHHF